MADNRIALPNGYKKAITEGEAPEGYIYEPPRGAPVNLNPPIEGKYYEADPPSKQTDRLLPYERRFTIPIAMAIAPVFDVVPIPDDVYRATPESARMSNLFCVISRSGITKDSNGTLVWDAVVVVVRKFCVVRVVCHLRPGEPSFQIKRVLLWSNRTEKYEPVEDPSGKGVNPDVLPYILEKYAQIEGIV